MNAIVKPGEEDPIASAGDGAPGYPGAKGGAGVYQAIINQIPPHDLFVEAFAGSGQVLLRKRPARSTIAIESDPAACERLKACIAKNGELAGAIVTCAEAISWLEKHRREFNHRTVVYCDPPYLMEVRTARRRLYGHEMAGEWMHGELLAVLSRLNTCDVKVLISGYRHDLYDRTLAHWRRVDYTATTRGSTRTESLWCNFAEPFALHDYRYLGSNFRERERIKRKRQRWRRRLEAMPALERLAVLSAIEELSSIAGNGEGRGAEL